MQNKNENSRSSKGDRIDGNTIILYDNDDPGPKVLKTVKILTPSGKRRIYTIKKTTNCGYLFN